MKQRLLTLPILAALVFVTACQKKETEAERNAEIERQVQERLAVEHQSQEQQRLTQAQADLTQRAQDLENGQNATPASSEEPSDTEAGPASNSEYGDEDEGQGTADYSVFYNRLEPEGSWIETSNYGYVFQPQVAVNVRTWRPYLNGHWVFTDAGWTWISEEPFGWACYHYGRWARIHNVGWVWVPGSQWAPAWVSWRTNDQYVGWAPLPPEARFERRRGIHHWADSYYDIGPEQFCFVSTANLGERRIEQVVMPSEQNITIVSQTTNVTNITYNNTVIVNNGPNYDQVRARSRQPIERLRLERQANANVTTDGRPVVKGDVVQVVAPTIGRAQGAERPRAVKGNLNQVTLERGWENIPDRQAAEQARNKIRSEATPPPNAPAKAFVRQTERDGGHATATPFPTVAARAATISPTPRNTPTPIATQPPPYQQQRHPVPLPTAQSTSTPIKVPPIPQADSLPTATPFIPKQGGRTPFPPPPPARGPSFESASPATTETTSSNPESGRAPFRPRRQPPAQAPVDTATPVPTATPLAQGERTINREPPERDTADQGQSSSSAGSPADNSTAQPNDRNERQLGVAPHGPPQRQRPHRLPPSPTPPPSR